MNSFLLTLATLVVLVLGALFAVPLFVDWNTYRAAIEQQASEIVGREVRIGGQVSLSLLPAPYLDLENIRVADVSGRFDNAFLRLERATVWLSIPPLLQGRVEARKVALVEPRLRLAIDSEGRGNWEGLGDTARFNLDAGDIALQSVVIEDGRISLHAPSNERILDFDKLSGELSAATLDGPFRFRGTTERSGIEHEVWLTTGRREPTGGIKFSSGMKPATRASGSGDYSFAGELIVGTDGARIEGGLVSRHAIPIGWTAGSIRSQALPADRGAVLPAELRATVEADGSALRFGQIALTFESGGRPQLVSGEATLDWREKLTLDSSFSARWLDLDRLASPAVGSSGADSGSEGDTGQDVTVGNAVALARPLAGLEAIAEAILAGAVLDGDARYRLAVEKLNLGGDLVDGLSLEVRRRSPTQPVEIVGLRAALPGSSHLAIEGRLTGRPSGGVAFGGTVELHGANLARVLKWAGGDEVSQLLHMPEVEDHFAIAASLAVDEAAIALREAYGELGQNAFRGAIQVGAGSEGKLQLRLESDRLDLRRIAPGDFHLAALGTELGIIADLEGDAAGGLPLARRLAGRDARLDIEIGEIVLPDRTLSDVIAKLGLESDRLQVDRLSLVSSDGIELSLEGLVEDARREPRGNLRYVVAGATPAAVEELLSGSSDLLADRIRTRLAGTLAPMRLAGVASFGQRGAATLDLSADGAAGASRIVALVRSDTPGGSLSEGLLDVTVSAETERPADLLVQLAPSRRRERLARVLADGSGSARASARANGFLSLRATGRLVDGMATVFGVEAGPLTAGFAGTTGLADGEIELSGTAELSTSNAVAALAILDADAAGFVHPGPLAFKSGLTASRRRIALASGAVRGDGLIVDGDGQVSFDDDVTRIDGSIRFADVSLGALMALSVAPSGSTAQETAIGRLQGGLAGRAAAIGGDDGDVTTLARSPEPQGGWLSDDPFDFSPLAGVSAEIRVFADRLEVAPDLVVEDARMGVRLEEGAITVSALEARALGGTLAARGAITKVPAGADLRLEVRGEAMKIAALLSAASGERLVGSVEPTAGSPAAFGVAAPVVPLPSPASRRQTIETVAAAGPVRERVVAAGPDDAAGGADEDAAQGTFDVEVQAGGRGLSPRGVATVLAGTGRLELSAGWLVGASPGAVSEESRNAIEAEEAVSEERLAERLRERLRDARFPFPGFELPFVIEDGTARVRGVRIAAADGRAALTMDTYLDFARLAYDSEWTLTEQPDIGERGILTLPPVTIVHSGPLNGLGRHEPRIEIGALARELTVRQMETNVERLEALRRATEGLAATGREQAGESGQPAAPPAGSVAVQRAPDSSLREPAVSETVVPKPLIVFDPAAAAVTIGGRTAGSSGITVAPLAPPPSSFPETWQAAPSAVPKRAADSALESSRIAPPTTALISDWRAAPEATQTTGSGGSVELPTGTRAAPEAVDASPRAARREPEPVRRQSGSTRRTRAPSDAFNSER